MSDTSKFLFKTDADYFEFLFKWKEFEKDCIPNLAKLLIEKHPLMHQCDESFVQHIYNLCELTCYQIFEDIWRIIIHNRQGKTPYDFPKLDFDGLKEYMKTYLPPKPDTGESYRNENFFIRMDEKGRQKFIDEINNDQYNGWLYVENYTKEFIRAMQDLLLELIPELINIGGDWWVVYEYRFRMEFFHFYARANRIERVIQCGLKGEWLDKHFSELDEKIKEIQLKEWHEKYGKNVA